MIGLASVASVFSVVILFNDSEDTLNVLALQIFLHVSVSHLHKQTSRAVSRLFICEGEGRPQRRRGDLLALQTTRCDYKSTSA